MQQILHLRSSLVQGNSLPKANDTLWNSTFIHLSSIAHLDLEPVKLAALHTAQNQSNLIITAKEHAVLQEHVDLLRTFSEATDITQRDVNAGTSAKVSVSRP